MYKKRIGFLINAEYLKPTGGNGQFAKSFSDLMHANGYKVDIITDVKPVNEKFATSISNKIYYNRTKSLDYGFHNTMFSRNDSFNELQMFNFHQSINLAFGENLYDIFVCNSPESIRVACTLGMSHYIQMIAYTHLQTQINSNFDNKHSNFGKDANCAMRTDLLHPNLFIGTQSSYNKSQFPKAYECPIPMPEKLILQKYNNKREGILFIGRYEEGKNYDDYIKLIKLTKLPARVITSDNGYKGFEKKFKENGIENYTIKSEIFGKEKIDFIVNSRVAFNSSELESYGIAFWEQMTQLPTVALDHVTWTNNFNSNYFFTCNQKNMVQVVLDLYEKFDTSEKYYKTGALENSIKMDKEVICKWEKCFNDFTPKHIDGDKKTFAKILNYEKVKYATFIKDLKRKSNILSLADDLDSVYNNRKKFNVIYTETDTYLSKDENFTVPEDEDEGVGLFEFER